MEKIKTLRELNHLSQEDMAEKLHMSLDGYAKLERGDRKAKIEQLELKLKHEQELSKQKDKEIELLRKLLNQSS